MILILASLISILCISILYRTFFVGLENNIPNSFLNGMIFLLWSMQSLRELILSHTCSTPLCLTCELKFLFRMFEQGMETRQEVYQ